MKVGIRRRLTDVITSVKFLVDRFRGYGVLTPQNCHFPLICCVALTTVCVIKHFDAFLEENYYYLFLDADY